ncbi:MAG TPA: HEAT repeat domain-containing protein [Bacteroidota bacterium]|nr:HEAT repeat domain-containing protein [Bacteroidota bacterium]
MSRTIRYFAIAAFAASIVTLSTAADKTVPAPPHPTKWIEAEKNYIHDLESTNDGVRASAAGFLGQYQLVGSVDALIHTLQTDKSELVRSTAAHSLMQMSIERGHQAVEDASLYDGSDKVAAYCTRLLSEKTLSTYSINEGE